MTVFSAQVENGQRGENGEPSVGPVYRSLLSKDKFPPHDDNMSTTWDIFTTSVEKYPENRMLGRRDFIDGKPGPYVWKTYKEVYTDALQIGSALRASSGAVPGTRIGIYGANCPQWIVAMQACSAHSLICVPLYDTLGPGAVDLILEHAEISTVFVQDKKLKELLSADCASSGRLKTIVCFTSATKEQTHNMSQLGMQHYSWDEFLQKITYAIRGLDLFMELFEDKMTEDDVYLSFLPLAHILDRGIEEYFFCKGASVGYYHGDLNALNEDLMELKPTFFAGVPRVFERVHEGVVKALDELRPLQRKIFNFLYQHKLSWLKLGYKHKEASRLADLLAFRKVKARLGGRIRLITSGGAPLSPEVEEFLRVTSCAFMTQGYGLTETCGMSTVTYPDEISMAGTVGVPHPYVELRLEEVSEMGYDPLGDRPCGEICLKGKTVFSGYYRNPELTKEVFRDGWFHTGDIGEILPNGALKIIDRKKHIFKLSQGEYVAVEYLEKTYSFTPIVEDIWVYGDSFRSNLVAVVVPHESNTKKWANLNGHKGSISDLLSLDQLQDFILLELKSTAERNKLKGFEHIKGVIVEPLPFDTARDFVTATLKKKRNQLLKHFKDEIDQLYQSLSTKKH